MNCPSIHVYTMVGGFFYPNVTFKKERCLTNEDKIMKDIIISGLLATVLLLLMLFAAPILNETEVNKDLVGTEEIAQGDNPEKETKIDSNIHTPL